MILCLTFVRCATVFCMQGLELLWRINLENLLLAFRYYRPSGGGHSDGQQREHISDHTAVYSVNCAHIQQPPR